MFTIQPYSRLAPRASTFDLLNWADALLDSDWDKSLSGLDYDQKEGIYSTELNLAGYKREEIQVEVTDNQVMVTAENKRRGKSVRSFYVSDIDTDRIQAKLIDGVLELKLPRLAETLPKRVEIG